jgi:hypothetical protein
MSETLTALEAQRRELVSALGKLGDLRRGSISGTGGRCGNPNCHCHAENHPRHAPHSRLTYKVAGKSVTESFASPAAQRKVEREVAEFRRYQEVSRAFLAVNEKICRARPVEETLPPQEKERRKRSSKSGRVDLEAVEMAVRGANSIIALRCARLSRGFDDYWDSRSLAP